MARKNSEPFAHAVYDAASDWKERCLLSDGCILSERKSLWTRELLDDPQMHGFTSNFGVHDGDFFSKLYQQVERFSPSQIQFIAECLWLMFLFPTRMKPKTKRDRIKKVWSWSGHELHLSQKPLNDSTLIGVGSAGANYSTRRWRELAFLINAVQKFKHLSLHERKEIANDPWNFADWFYKDFEARIPQMGHILTHLLFPDEFERLSARGQKVQVLNYFRNLSEDEFDKRSMIENDKEILVVRDELQNQKNRQIDFYDEDIALLWRRQQEISPTTTDFVDPKSDHSCEAFGDSEQPINLIIHGPPGTGKTRELNRVYLPRYSDGEYNRFEFITFHQSYSYEDFVEGIRPVNKGGLLNYEVRWGPLRRICDRAQKTPDQRFALLIDELNRGNVAKIFGELITLMEIDNRIRIDSSGQKLPGVGVEVTLPYSGEVFGVPANLDLICTMNTANRSIRKLDSALRRRFEFKELTPQPGKLSTIDDGDGGKIDLPMLLDTMNRRLIQLRHRDQTLGHSYLIDVKSFDDLRWVFVRKILPFLQETFYDDWGQIRLVLADHAADPDLQLIRERQFSSDQLFPGVNSNEVSYAPVFEIIQSDEITPDAIRKIYEI